LKHIVINGLSWGRIIGGGSGEKRLKVHLRKEGRL